MFVAVEEALRSQGFDGIADALQGIRIRAVAC
jgi:hypothetical protein